MDSLTTCLTGLSLAGAFLPGKEADPSLNAKVGRRGSVAPLGAASHSGRCKAGHLGALGAGLHPETLPVCGWQGRSLRRSFRSSTHISV